MQREELITSPEYITAGLQIELFNKADEYMNSRQMTRTQLAEYLGASKREVTELLNGDYDRKLSKLVSLSIKLGYIPTFQLTPIDEFIKADKEATAHHRRHLPNQ